MNDQILITLSPSQQTRTCQISPISATAIPKYQIQRELLFIVGNLFIWRRIPSLEISVGILQDQMLFNQARQSYESFTTEFCVRALRTADNIAPQTGAIVNAMKTLRCSVATF